MLIYLLLALFLEVSAFGLICAIALLHCLFSEPERTPDPNPDPPRHQRLDPEVLRSFARARAVGREPAIKLVSPVQRKAA